MQETLFPLPISPSPRLAWMAEHNVTTHYSFDEDFGKHWQASIGIPPDISEAYRMEDTGCLCYGTTEIEALEKLCARQNWRHWNQ